MPILHECTVEGCSILTIGPLCVDHDQPATDHGPRDVEVEAPPPVLQVIW